MSKLFNIIGLRHPGRVDVFQIGTVDLFTADDKVLLKIYNTNPNFKYLRPTQEGMKILYPESVIKIKPLHHNKQVKSNVEEKPKPKTKRNPKTKPTPKSEKKSGPKKSV